jgi:predicted transcriptional regulator
MSPVNQSAIRLLQSLADDCSLDDIHYHLYVREKVEHGLAAIDAGHVLSQEDAECRISEWGPTS